MTAPRLSHSAASDARRAWLVGGALLIATVVVDVALQPAVLLIFGGNIIGSVLFSAALLVFAFGIRGPGSVTARRPLGTAALTVLAAWVLVVSALNSVIFSNDLAPGTLLAFGYGDSLVQFLAALIAVSQIGRAGVVPAPWNWAPAWTLAAVVAPWVLGQVVSVGPSMNSAPILTVVIALDSLARVGGPVFLGVLAIVLASRPRRQRTVPVFPASDSTFRPPNGV